MFIVRQLSQYIQSRKQQESFASGCWVYRSFKAALPRMFPFLKEFGIRRTHISYEMLPQKSVLPVEIPLPEERNFILRPVEIEESLYQTMAGNLAKARLRQLSQVGELDRQWRCFYRFCLGDLTKIF